MNILISLLIVFLPIVFCVVLNMYLKESKKELHSIRDEMNMLDEAKWIEKVIKSCKTYKQLTVSHKLRWNLYDKYKNRVDINLLSKVCSDLDWVDIRVTNTLSHEVKSK